MNKDEALTALGAVLESKWKAAQAAFETSRAGATGDQVKQESKYDTRGLEESYLAHGLANSVMEYEKAISDLNQCRLAPVSETVRLGSFVTCRRDDELVYFLISASGGGIEAQVGDGEVTLITTESPLAGKLMGQSVNDRIAPPMMKIEAVA